MEAPQHSKGKDFLFNKWWWKNFVKIEISTAYVRHTYTNSNCDKELNMENSVKK